MPRDLGRRVEPFGREHSFTASTTRGEPLPDLEDISALRRAALPMSTGASDDFSLDALTDRLNRPQHRLGAFDSRPTEGPPHTEPFGSGHLSNGTSSGPHAQIRLQTFQNDFEWRAAKFELPLQEILIMEDLLYLLLGLSGRYVVKDSSEENAFLVDESLSPSIVESIVPILRAGCSFDYLERFAATNVLFSDGRICQAFSARIRQLLQEFRQVVVMLERKFNSGSLGLQQFGFHLQPFERNLQVLSATVRTINEQRLRGGSILVLLERSIGQHSGDKAIRSMLEDLLVKCAAPFLDMLSGWLQSGLLDDPCGEFMIRPRNDRDPILYGSEAYSLTLRFLAVPENMPSICQAAMGKIVQIGAFHNILKGYAGDPEDYTGNSLESALLYDQRRIGAIVERCFANVNRRMLGELLAQDRLISALKVCKRYYFMENADLINSFLDAHRKDLDRPASAVIAEHIQSGWESTQRSFPLFMEDIERLECYQADLSLPDQLQRIISASDAPKSQPHEQGPRGLDLFSIRVKFDFPDTLIFNGESLAKYELIFRLLFRLADLSRSLSTVPAAPIKGHARGGTTKGFLLLRRQMLHLVQNVQQYLSYDVFEPNWAKLTEAIRRASGMDTIMQVHNAFIDSCLRQAMLTNSKLVQLITLLFTNCSRLHALQGESWNDASEMQAKVGALQSSFNKTMRMFLEALQYYSSRDYDYHLGTLFSRLDYNSYYYSSSFGADLAPGGGAPPADRRRMQGGPGGLVG